MSIIYQQDWSEGNGDQFFQHSYRRRNDKALGTTPADSVYPEVIDSETVQVLTGGGPNGENVLDWWNDPLSGTDDYQTSGITLDAGQFDANGPIQATVSYKPNAASLADNAYAPLFYFYHAWPHSGPVSDGTFELAADHLVTPAGNWRLSMTYKTWNSGTPVSHTVNSYAFSGASVQDAWQNYRVKWKCGTVTLDPDPDWFYFQSVASDGYLQVYAKNGAGAEALIYDIQNIDLYLWDPQWNTTNENNPNFVGIVGLGQSGLFGKETKLVIETEDIVVPPMQRASYVFFSNQITERQVETRLTKTFLQLLYADPPGAVTPGSLTLTEITGDLYDQEGNQVTTGTLLITPDNIIQVDGQYLISPATVKYSVAGPLSIMLAPSPTVYYTMEYDPTPEDTVTPINLKIGYFKMRFLVPSTGPVDIAEL